MKIKLLPAALILIAGPLAIACGTMGRYPEGMSGRTAMQFFQEEELTLGVNLGNTLDAFRNWSDGVADETAWGNPPANQAMFEAIKELGFNVVRIPVTWMGHIGEGPDYRIGEARMERVAYVVNLAREAGLKVIINMHHDGATSSPVEEAGWLSIGRSLGSRAERARITAQFERMWIQIAERFKDYGEWLMFQGFNELHVGDWGSGDWLQYDVINEWNQVFTNAVRRTRGGNRFRFLVISGYNTSYRTAEAHRDGIFRLPNDPTPNRQIVNFHFYQPNNFALFTQTYEWPNDYWGGSRESIDNIFAGFREQFVDRGIPVIIGEVGPARYTPHNRNPGFDEANVPIARQNRLAYIAHVYGRARENGLVPIVWENGGRHDANAWEGDFTLFDRHAGRPNTDESAEVIQAMVDAVNNAFPPW